MDDMISKLQDILGSEEGMQKLKEVADMLGVGAEHTDAVSSSSGNLAQSNGFDFSALSSLLSGGNGNTGETAASSDSELGNLDLNMIIKLQQAMSAFHSEDDNTRFLQALRPLMREERRHKVDEVLRMMKLFSLIPLLKESGLLEKLF